MRLKTMLQNKKIVIVGLGLMGASLGLAVRKAHPRAKVIGLSRTLETIHAARGKGVIHWGSTNLHEVIPQADFVVICTPVHTLASFIAEIDRFARKGTVVTDVGSAKEDVVNWADRQNFKNIRFVGSHPMAGSHERGLKAARPALYKDALCFVVHGKKTDRRALQRVVYFWKTICRDVHVIDSKLHDKVVAQVSHLPHVLSSLLVAGTDTKHLPFVGPGFRDTTRIAKGNPELWHEIIRENRTNIERELKGFKKSIDTFLKDLQADKNERILHLLESAAKKRNKLDSEKP
jgi:prephenate dehydrogenase